MLKRVLVIPRLFNSGFKKPEESDFVKSFEQLGLPEKVLNHLKEFTAPSQIQSKSMKSLMQGQDMIAIAPTGSGKTLAFAIPALVKSAELHKNRRSSVSTLIVCPTRQLSNQITSAIKPIANQFGLRIANLFGGAPKRDQFYDARMAQVIVATPGRLRDYLSSGNPDKLKNVQSLILDEADRMLDMGFEQQVKQIVSQTPPQRQTALFSATWQKQIQGMASSYIKSDAVYVQIGNNTHSINPNITQQFKYAGYREAKQDIAKAISEPNLKKVLIFCNTKQQTRKLAFELNEMTDKSVNFITSDLDQYQRTSVMQKFRESQNSIMIATDVASRGIDVKDIELVINYGFPMNSADFIHRVGRTGRGGKSGKSLTYIFKGDTRVQKDLKFIAKLYSNEKLQVPPSLLQIIEQLGINIGFRQQRGGNSQRSGRFNRDNRSRSYREQTLQPTKKSQNSYNNNSQNNFRSRTNQSRSIHYEQNDNSY